MSWLPDDIREASGGEVVDNLSHDAIKLAHKALERFPELVRRHKYIAGGAALSSSLVVLAGVAVAQRMRRGQTAEEAVSSVTEEEMEGRVRLADTDLDDLDGVMPAAGLEEIPGADGEPEQTIPAPAPMPPLPVYTNGSKPAGQADRDATATGH